MTEFKGIVEKPILLMGLTQIEVPINSKLLDVYYQAPTDIYFQGQIFVSFLVDCYEEGEREFEKKFFRVLTKDVTHVFEERFNHTYVGFVEVPYFEDSDKKEVLYVFEVCEK